MSKSEPCPGRLPHGHEWRRGRTAKVCNHCGARRCTHEWATVYDHKVPYQRCAWCLSMRRIGTCGDEPPIGDGESALSQALTMSARKDLS
jgi:hypothetical protein